MNFADLLAHAVAFVLTAATLRSYLRAGSAYASYRAELRIRLDCRAARALGDRFLRLSGSRLEIHSY